MSELICPDCEQQLDGIIDFCTNCGANLEEVDAGSDVFFADSDFETTAEEPPSLESSTVISMEPIVAPSPPPVIAPRVEIPSSNDDPPNLVMDTGVSARVGENGVLWFGLANNRTSRINARLAVNMDKGAREMFHHFNGERELRVGPSGEGTASVSFRAQVAGELPLSVRLFVEDYRASGKVSFYQVADHCKVFFGISSQQSGGSITVHNEVCIDRNYGGDISIRPEALRSIQEKMGVNEGANRAAPQELPLEAPESVQGWIQHSRNAIRGSHLRLDVMRLDKLYRRFHILVCNELWFGRNDVTQLPGGRRGFNTLALRWLPCRSKEQDPKSFSFNQSISRHHAGMLHADEAGTAINCCSSSLQVDTHQLGKGDSQQFHAGSAYRLKLGHPALEFDITPLTTSGEDPSQWLRDWNQFTGMSGAIVHPTRHDAIRIDRVNNLEQVSYVMLLQSASIGGGRRDACFVKGLPPAVLRLARCGSNLFVLTGPDFVNQGTAAADERYWRPICAGDRYDSGEWSYRFSTSSVSDTKREDDLVSALEDE